MNLLSWGFLGGAAASAAVAIQAGNDLRVALPAGAVAVLLVAVVGAMRLFSTVSRWAPARAGMIRRVPPARVESDSLLRLSRAFRTGEIGRWSILATIRALERDLSPTKRTVLSLEAERAVLELPPEQFRQWIDDRLSWIEAVT